MERITCRFDGCPHPIRAKNLCRRHSEQARAGTALAALAADLPLDPICVFEGCPFGAASMGVCGGHAAPTPFG